MKQGLLTTLLLALITIMPTYAADWQAKTDTIWPARHYRELNGQATGSQRSKSYINWNYPEGTVLVYGIHFPTGHVRADALFRAKSETRVTFGVRIVHPATGTVVLDTTIKSTKNTTAEQRMEIMPDTEMPYDGWYRFELTCPGGGNTLDRLNLLLFQRTSALSITDSEIFMAPSVHLWWSTKVPGAPSGQSYNWTYLEVMYPSAYRQPASYQMAIGTDGMYSGIQMPTRSDGSYGHTVLFSVWDNGDTDKDKSLPDIMRAGAVDLGPDAYATRFGGEGTGSSIRYNRDDLWEFDHWVQFLYNVRPDIVSVTNEDGSVSEFESTLQTVWYKMAEENDWHYMGTLRMAAANRLTSGIYSFLENFGDTGGELMRRCYFRNGAMRSAATGQWYALNYAGFGNTQNKGTRNSRYDFGHGVTQLYDKTFYLETGGYMGKRDSANTCEPPLMGEMPWVDTINIARLERRVDEGVLHYNSKTMKQRIETTRTVSDPATWKLISFSDEETVGEGDYGRAAMMLDGDRSSYYHNRWKSNAAGYPHTFTFEAPEPVTVSSLEIYQNRESKYRAKQMAFYMSEDGSRWTTVSSRLTIEDTESPTVTLPEPVTAKFFRLRFTSGYGSNLVINELYFKHEYRLGSLLDLARQIFEESDAWGGYAPADLEPLRTVYADGTCTDIDALRETIREIGATAQPLTYGVVAKAESFTPMAVYQLHNASGRGDLIATTDGVLSIAASNSTTAPEAYRQKCRVSDPYCNWMILRSEKYNESYLYNLGTGKYLSVDGSELTLSDIPTTITLSKSGDGFTINAGGKYVGITPSGEKPVVLQNSGGSGAIFQLRTNQYLRPSEDAVHGITAEGEQAVHENTPDYLFLQGIQTYGKAFVAYADTESKLIRTSSYLSSNANTNQQEEHSLAKLIDGKTNTYYETWYSGITWPDEMSYIQARTSGDIQAFAFSFTPSQNPEYGQPDIPSDIIVSASATMRNLLPVARITEGLPTNISESYTSPVLFTDGASRFLRFQVMQTLGKRADSRIFAMSEFQVHNAIIDEAASPYYQRPEVKEAFDALQTELQSFRSHISANSVTSEDRQALREAIDRAEEILKNGTGIEIIQNSKFKIQNDDAVYDLTGRKIVNCKSSNSKLPKGIYIQSGKKILK
ncbi:MAG: DUF3472 domain-containing protein [Bacteroidaceae bacterium]|nr:DUF3472 domain-containing protein [Bacteroidaceae bacterium]